MRAHILFINSESIHGLLSNIIRVEAHVLRIRVSLDLHIWSNIFKLKLFFTVIWAFSHISLYCSFPFLDLISTEMTQVIHAAIAHHHIIEIAKTHRTVVFELIPLFSFLGQEITTFYFFKFMLGVNINVRFFRWLFLRYLLHLLLLSLVSLQAILPFKVLLLLLPSWIILLALPIPIICVLSWSCLQAPLRGSLVIFRMNFIRVRRCCFLMWWLFGWTF